jgi:hypothetical protein
MAFYVSVKETKRNGRAVLAAGPFNRHGDAERCVGHVHHVVAEQFPNEAPWVGFGTCRVRHGEMRPGRFNADIGLPTDGRRIADLPIADNRWW